MIERVFGFPFNFPSPLHLSFLRDLLPKREADSGVYCRSGNIFKVSPWPGFLKLVATHQETRHHPSVGIMCRLKIQFMCYFVPRFGDHDVGQVVFE